MNSQPRLVRLSVSAAAHLLDLLSGELFEAGATGIEEHPGALVIYAEDEPALQELLRAVTRFKQSLSGEDAESVSVTTREQDPSWQATWQNALLPERITERWVLRPTHRAPAPDRENTLWFEPALSFGSGGHPTTVLAASHLERHVRPGESVLDVGTGTGVLAMVAAKTGANRILAVDNDPESVRSARHNISLNQLSETIQVELGSADFSEETFSWVVANINTPILHELFPAFQRALAPQGHLLLTGLLEEDEESLLEAARNMGLHRQSVEHSQPWSLLRLSRKPQG